MTVTIIVPYSPIAYEEGKAPYSKNVREDLENYDRVSVRGIIGKDGKFREVTDEAELDGKIIIREGLDFSKVAFDRVLDANKDLVKRKLKIKSIKFLKLELDENMDIC